MTPEQEANADKWVAALRSGKYKQGRSFLRNDDRYCCLGVLCEVLGVDSIVRDCSSVHQYGTEVSYLPIEVARKMGMTISGHYRVMGSDGFTNDNSLTRDNDTGKSFEEIADVIESKPEGLFL